VLVGGGGNIRGVTLGVLIMGLLVQESTRFLPDLPGLGTFNTLHPQVLLAMRGAIIGLVLVLFLRFRPQGLLPERRFVDRQVEKAVIEPEPLTA